MTAEEIFKSALRELADDGNEKAKFALDLAKRVCDTETTSEMRPNVIRELKSANENLSTALSHNDRRWTTATDRSIADAQKCIINALAFMAR